MNKEEAIEILSEMRSEYNLFGDEEEATRYHVLSWAIKEMNAVPAWIPVTEQPLMKVGDYGYNGYLVWANGYYEVADYTTDKFDHVPCFHVDGEYEPNVTHWMPLPEPPKGERINDDLS